MFRHQILGLLRDGKPRHGYALVQDYTRRTGVPTNSGYAYRDLQRLVEEGMVRVAANEQGADRRRRPYVITDAGRASFDQWFSDLPPVSLGNDGEMAARAIFFEEVEPERVRAVLDEWRHDLWLLSKRIEHEMTLPRGRPSTGTAARVILKRRKMLAALELRFLDDLREAFGIEEGDPTAPALEASRPEPARPFSIRRPA